VSTARPIPSAKPLSELSGVLKSACASSQTMPTSRPSPATIPIEFRQFPESTMGNAPSSTARETASLTRRAISKDAPISFVEPACGTTLTTSTSWPASSRASTAPSSSSRSGPAPTLTPSCPRWYGAVTREIRMT
jgi:hypothetical protein